MESKLRSCPFCGGEHLSVEKISYSVDGAAYRVECDCGARGPWSDTKEQAIEIWNKRAQTVFGMTLDEVRKMMERTCEVVETSFDELDEYPHTWLSCGHHTMLLPREIQYCPKCGAMVLEPYSNLLGEEER